LNSYSEAWSSVTTVNILEALFNYDNNNNNHDDNDYTSNANLVRKESDVTIENCSSGCM